MWVGDEFLMAVLADKVLHGALSLPGRTLSGLGRMDKVETA